MSSHDDYMDTVKRIEPDVHPLDGDGALASIAISLKRIADTLTLIHSNTSYQPNEYNLFDVLKGQGQ